MNVGLAVRLIAEKKGLRQADICTATGYSDAYVSMLFNGKIPDPKASRAYKLARALGVSVDTLVKIADSY